MNAFITSYFSYCPPILIFHKNYGKKSQKILLISPETWLCWPVQFDVLATTGERWNRKQTLAIKIYKSKINISLELA